MAKRHKVDFGIKKTDWDKAFKKKPKCKAPGMCEGGWNKPEPLKDKEIEPPVRVCSELSCHTVVFDYYDVKSAVEWLKKEFDKAFKEPVTTEKEARKKSFELIDKAFEDVTDK